MAKAFRAAASGKPSKNMLGGLNTTIGFWTDPGNKTLFGIDLLPLEIVWRYEGYRQ